MVQARSVRIVSSRCLVLIISADLGVCTVDEHDEATRVTHYPSRIKGLLDMLLHYIYYGDASYNLEMGGTLRSCERVPLVDHNGRS